MYNLSSLCMNKKHVSHRFQMLFLLFISPGGGAMSTSKKKEGQFEWGRKKNTATKGSAKKLGKP